MDELVHHCLRELAFDGDLGESRLRDPSLAGGGGRQFEPHLGMGVLTWLLTFGLSLRVPSLATPRFYHKLLLGSTSPTSTSR
jgi:hypothetical protein